MVITRIMSEARGCLMFSWRLQCPYKPLLRFLLYRRQRSDCTRRVRFLRVALFFPKGFCFFSSRTVKAGVDSIRRSVNFVDPRLPPFVHIANNIKDQASTIAYLTISYTWVCMYVKNVVAPALLLVYKVGKPAGSFTMLYRKPLKSTARNLPPLGRRQALP